MKYSLSLTVAQDTDVDHTTLSRLASYVCNFSFSHLSFDDKVEITRSIYSGGTHHVRVASNDRNKVLAVYVAAATINGCLTSELKSILYNFAKRTDMAKTLIVKYDHRTCRKDNAQFNFRSTTPYLGSELFAIDRPLVTTYFGEDKFEFHLHSKSDSDIELTVEHGGKWYRLYTKHSLLDGLKSRERYELSDDSLNYIYDSIDDKTRDLIFRNLKLIGSVELVGQVIDNILIDGETRFHGATIRAVSLL